MKMKNKFFRQDNHRKMIITSIPREVWKVVKSCLVRRKEENDSVMISHFKKGKR